MGLFKSCFTTRHWQRQLRCISQDPKHLAAWAPAGNDDDDDDEQKHTTWAQCSELLIISTVDQCLWVGQVRSGLDEVWHGLFMVSIHDNFGFLLMFFHFSFLFSQMFPACKPGPRGPKTNLVDHEVINNKGKKQTQKSLFSLHICSSAFLFRRSTR